VEDGVPFCKQCGAPQIRVIGIEPAPAPPDLSDTDQPAVSPLGLPSLPSARVQWSRALPGAALGGVFSLLASAIPFAIFGPAFLAGGALSVMLYRRHDKQRIPAVGAGAQIGAASGGFGFLFPAILLIATLVYRPEELRQGVLDSVSHALGRGYDPAKLQQVQELLKTPHGLTFFVAFGLFLMFLIFVVGSSIGGALYAAWVRKRASL
jgi:hypothetical protein